MTFNDHLVKVRKERNEFNISNNLKNVQRKNIEKKNKKRIKQQPPKDLTINNSITTVFSILTH